MYYLYKRPFTLTFYISKKEYKGGDIAVINPTQIKDEENVTCFYSLAEEMKNVLIPYGELFEMIGEFSSIRDAVLHSCADFINPNECVERINALDRVTRTFSLSGILNKGREKISPLVISKLRDSLKSSASDYVEGFIDNLSETFQNDEPASDQN